MVSAKNTVVKLVGEMFAPHLENPAIIVVDGSKLNESKAEYIRKIANEILNGREPIAPFGWKRQIGKSNWTAIEDAETREKCLRSTIVEVVDSALPPIGAQ